VEVDWIATDSEAGRLSHTELAYYCGAVRRAHRGSARAGRGLLRS